MVEQEVILLFHLLVLQPDPQQWMLKRQQEVAAVVAVVGFRSEVEMVVLV